MSKSPSTTDDVTGEVQRGRIAPADRLGVRAFLTSLTAGRVDVALEATTGWRFIVEELVAAGVTAHLAEPAETANLRGRKARAKTTSVSLARAAPTGAAAGGVGRLRAATGSSTTRPSNVPLPTPAHDP